MSGKSDVRPSDQTDRVHWRYSLRNRIALWSGAVSVLVVVVLTLGMAWYAYRQIDRKARLDTLANAQQAAEQLDMAMHGVAVTARGLADLATDAEMDPDTLTRALFALVKATPGCVGGLLVLEPRVRGDGSIDDSGAGPIARYIDINGANRDFIAEGYDYRTQPWFQRTLAEREGWWSEPYFNETAGDTWMITFNQPLNQPLRPSAEGDGAVQGMVSLDLPLSALTDHLQTLAHLPGWRVSLVAPGGMLAINPDVAVTRMLTLDDFIRIAGRSDLAPAADAVRERRRLQLLHTDALNGETRFTVVEPVGYTEWSLLVAQSHALVLAQLRRALELLALSGIALAGVCMLLVRQLAKRIGRPVEQLAHSASRLADGHYETPVPHTRRRDEVGLMARTLEHARVSIQRQLVEIGEMGAARQKLESELAIARDIQLAMLPPGRVIDSADHQLEAYAQLEPAKAVGGDFYSFVEHGDGGLWFAIGDVSDKGVPAALFMARTATVLEAAARSGGSPDQVLASASRRLVEGNDTCMFATVLCGRIDVRSGDCTLASAGHDPPVLVHPDGHVEILPVESGMPLGFEASDIFPPWRGRLVPGTTLLAYTDGVTEAFDAQNRAFGLERLVATVHANHDARGQCEHLIAEVHAFADPGAQDDITVLAIRLRLDTTPGTPPMEIARVDTPDRPG